MWGMENYFGLVGETRPLKSLELLLFFIFISPFTIVSIFVPSSWLLFYSHLGLSSLSWIEIA